MTTWHYRILQWNSSRPLLNKGMILPENELNRYGEQGWELVNVIQSADGSLMAAFLKKPRLEPEAK